MLWYENNARHKIVIIPVIHICTWQTKQKSMLVQSPHIWRHALVGERKGIIIPKVTMQVHLGIISFYLPHSGIQLAFNDLSDEAILPKNQRNMDNTSRQIYINSDKSCSQNGEWLELISNWFFHRKSGPENVCIPYSMTGPWDLCTEVKLLFSWIPSIN